jgi:hypothetical protein
VHLPCLREGWPLAFARATRVAETQEEREDYWAMRSEWGVRATCGSRLKHCKDLQFRTNTQWTTNHWKAKGSGGIWSPFLRLFLITMWKRDCSWIRMDTDWSSKWPLWWSK